MSSSELRFRRTVKIDGKEETVDLLTLALKREAEYDKDSFPDFLDIIYFMKQILALVFGIVWGIVPFTGAFGLVTGLVWVVGLPLVYATRYIHVNTDDFDVMTILQEGAMQGICLYLVAWIVTYSAFHF